MHDFCLAELDNEKKNRKDVILINRRSNVSVYTDGSCDGNPGHGGYAAIIQCGRFYKEIAGSVLYSTINRMELTAVLHGLSVVRPQSKVTVYTDSAYVEQAFNSGRITQWENNGWRRIRTGTEVLNKDVFSILLATIRDRKLDVTFQKIAAHKGHKLNNRADYLARQAAKKS